MFIYFYCEIQGFQPIDTTKFLMTEVTTPVEGMDEMKELQWLRIQCKDLMQKVEILKAKRDEDHPKVVEYEKNRIELQTLREYKTTVQKNNNRLQHELQRREKELDDMRKIQRQQQEQLIDMHERIELLTVEREMAEERVDLLQTELDSGKQRIEELEEEVGILRDEIEHCDNGTLQKDGVQLRQLEQQNEKFREAVVRMRDIIVQLNADKNDVLQENERLKDETATLVKLCETLKANCQIAEGTVGQLKEKLLDVSERVDAVTSSEKIIEDLTTKNLELESRLRTLQDAVEDFETIRAMDEEILETQKIVEGDLRQEYESVSNKAIELSEQVQMYMTQMDVYEATFLKFRGKIDTLNNEIQDQKDEILRLHARLKSVEDGDDVANLRSRLTTVHNFAKMVEAEVCALELECSVKYANFLKLFLPDSFAKAGGDDDAVLLFVRCTRLPRKSLLLSKALNEKFSTVPGGMRREHVLNSHKAEQWAFCAKFISLLRTFETDVRKFESAMNQCTVESLSRIARLQGEIEAQERMIDQYIELLKSDRFDENTSTDALERGIVFFQNMFALHMAGHTVGESYDVQQFIVDVIGQLFAIISWIKLNMQRIIFYCLPESGSFSIRTLIGSLENSLKECEQLLLRVNNAMLVEKALTVASESEKMLLEIVTSVKKLALVVDNTCSFASVRLSTMIDADGFGSDRLKEMLQSATAKVYGQINSSTLEEFLSTDLNAIKCSIEQLLTMLEGASCDESSPVRKSLSPLLERANSRKQDILEAEKLRWLLEKKENELVELKKNYKSLAVDISNYKVRLEYAERKIETLEKVQETKLKCEELQDELIKAKRDYEETLLCMQRDLLACEDENAELKRRIMNINKKIILGNLSLALSQSAHSSAATTPADPTPPSIQSQSADLAYLEREIKEKQYALQCANQRIRYLKVFETLYHMSVMKPLSNSSDVCGPVTLMTTHTEQRDELNSLYMEAERILSETRMYQLPYVYDVSKSKNTRRVEDASYRMRIAILNRQIDDLKYHLHLFWKKHYQNRQLHTRFSSRHDPVAKKFERLEAAAESSKGIHSDLYRNAFSKLFGELEVKRSAPETTSGQT